jgi:hypothetical protein
MRWVRGAGHRRPSEHAEPYGRKSTAACQALPQCDIILVNKNREKVAVRDSPLLSDPEVLAVRASYCATLERFPPPLADAGRRVLDRISTPNWTLEWYLPRWLSETFGLQPDVTRALVLSNVYGLTYIRLQDDLVDGEVDQASWKPTILLAGALYHQAMLHYIRLFEWKSPFWGYFKQFMAQWQRATLSSNEPPATDFGSYEEADFLRLAERGAPLKICCAGACLLAEQEEVIPTLTSAMDHLLVGAVLLDHAHDWTDDLAAGRYNVFVAYASPLPQLPHQQETNRRRVLEELYLGEAARPYFDLARKHIQIAIETARTLDCQGLSQHLLSFNGQAATCGEQLADEARARLRAAAEQLFGLPVMSDPPAIAADEAFSLQPTQLVDSAQAALAFLSRRQLPSGEWETLFAPTRDLAAGRPVSNVFVTAYIVRTLGSCHESKVAGADNLRLACDFLEDEQSESGLWRFFGRHDSQLPADLDCTACSAAALLLTGRRLDVASIVRETRRYRHPRGGFWTWAMPPSATHEAWPYHIRRNVTDWVVDANVLFLFELADYTCPGLLPYLRTVLRARQYQQRTPYYDCPLLFLYNLSGALALSANWEDSTLRTEIGHHAWSTLRGRAHDSVLEIALAASTLSRCGWPVSKIEPLARQLLEEQMPDHGWRIEPFFHNKLGYFGSREVVTTLAVEALLLGVNAMISAN